jgi:hypothetical protein
MPELETGAPVRPANLMDALLAECNRVRELARSYDEIGPAGALGAELMRAEIAQAEEAMGSGDTLAMIAVYHDLQAWSDE